jgi:hypothetical protein
MSMNKAVTETTRPASSARMQLWMRLASAAMMI